MPVCFIMCVRARCPAADLIGSRKVFLQRYNISLKLQLNTVAVLGWQMFRELKSPVGKRDHRHRKKKDYIQTVNFIDFGLYVFAAVVDNSDTTSQRNWKKRDLLTVTRGHSNMAMCNILYIFIHIIQYSFLVCSSLLIVTYFPCAKHRIKLQ